MKNLTIKTSLFRVRYRRDDGSKQLKILVKIGYKADNKFNEIKRFQITIRDKMNNIYLVNDHQYDRLRAQPPNEERLHLFGIETKIKKIVMDLVNLGKDFGVKEINNRLYTIQGEEAVDTKIKSWNEFLNIINYGNEDQEFELEEIERIKIAIEETADQNQILTDEDIDGIKNAVGVEMQIEKEKKYIKTLSFEERYAKGKYDKDDIIELFGFCWSKNHKNGDPYVADSYKSLIFNFADYFINGDNVSKSVKNFNLNWVNKFLSFKIKKGYSTTRLRGYTPFNILDYRDSFIKAPRKDYKYAAFQKVVKILRQYIDILQKEGKLPMNSINTSHIETSDYISRNVNLEKFTKIEYTLEYEEILQLLNANFDDLQIQLATDMYIIQMFAGGLRLSELYNGNIRFTDNYVSFYRSKNKKITKNPILLEVREVLKKYPDGLPPFPKIDDYRKQLKRVADHFVWDRIIEEPNTQLNSDSDIITHKLREIFSPLTARKTFINYLANMGLADELIIQFTEHKDVEILKHYKRKLNLTQKKTIMEKLLREFLENE